jgi:hypothetical protein
MAAVSLSVISAALSQLFDPMWTKAMNRQCVLASLISKGEGEGKNCAWDVEFSGASAAAYAEGADASTFDSDESVPATLNWGQLRSSFQLTGTALAAAAGSRGSPEKLINLRLGKAEGSASKLLSLVNSQLYTGSGANNVTGLQSALAATGTYAGIAKASYSEWVGLEQANGGTPRPLTKSILDAAERAAYVASGRSPNCFILTPALGTKFEGLFDGPAKSQISPDISPLAALMGSNGVIPPVLVQNLVGYYKGRPVFRDKDCPTGQLFALNTDELKLVVLPQVTSDTAVMQAQMGLKGNDADAASGLSAKIIALAKTGDSEKYSLQIYLQLMVKCVNAHVWVKDLDES